MIKVFGREGCDYCTKAVDFLDRHKVSYEYVDVGLAENVLELNNLRKQGFRTIPQVYDGTTHIGGYEDLLEWGKVNLVK